MPTPTQIVEDMTHGIWIVRDPSNLRAAGMHESCDCMLCASSFGFALILCLAWDATVNFLCAGEVDIELVSRRSWQLFCSVILHHHQR